MSDPSDKVFLPNSDTISFFDSNSFSNSANLNQMGADSNSQSSSCLKETGIIEKMLVSYGFIQCCERQARLFFHFSQYLENIDHLKIGDPVEYETAYDRRTGKPVAVNIKKIASNDFMTKLSKTERLSGVIATEMTNDREGRIAFENMGEFFFLPFSREDVTDNVNFKANEKVSFVLTTDDSGSYRATGVQLEASNSANNQGVISCLKDTFGFIEKSDCMTKIFFHSSDCSNFKSLNVGDIVQFNMATRKNKELAVDVVKQTISDEEFSETVHRGQVTKYNNRSSIASGSIYCSDLKKEFFFYEKDVQGKYTLNPSDYVKFQIATDRRTHYQRAINIVFLSETFVSNSEQREKGYVASLKESYGFIKCPSKEGSLIYFKQTELLDPSIVLKLNDEVEFTLININDAQNKRCQAVRISILPNGTIFNNILSKKPNAYESVREDFSLIDLSCPLIYNTDTLKDTQFNEDGIKVNGNGDGLSSTWTKELMDIFQKKENDLSMKATGGSILDFSDPSVISMIPEIQPNQVKKTGIVAVMKENYGFIESADGENEYYFHISSCNDENCKLGQSVEFNTILLNNKWKAINVSSISPITKFEDDLSETFTGIVKRTILMFETDQMEYTGLIAKNPDQSSNEMENGWVANDQYEFSMISLKFLKDYISVGDSVRFQVATNPITKKKRAYNVEVIRDRLKGTILTLQRGFGFVKPDSNVTTFGNIYFNSAEIRNGVKIKVGDRVDYLLIKNKKTEKFYAIDINKIEDISMVTDRTLLKNFFKMHNDNGPKVIVIRQPRAPDGSKGFLAEYRQ